MGKKLGQYFLKNRTKLKKIADALDLKTGDFVIEIGPGHGELTEAIIERLKNLKIEKFRIILIEKDGSLANFLRNKFKNEKNIEIVEGDALKEIKNQISSIKNKRNNKLKIIENLKITGNIPYYITGYLLRIIGDLEYKPKLVVLTIQKEVAERICVVAPKMNLLAASVQVWAKPEIILKIARGNFNPSPKVDSATILLTTRDKQKTAKELGNYFKFIGILFKQPRKTILNNLQLITSNRKFLENKIKTTGIDPKKRPQNLDIEQILILLRFLADRQ